MPHTHTHADYATPFSKKKLNKYVRQDVVIGLESLKTKNRPPVLISQLSFQKCCPNMLPPGILPYQAAWAVVHLFLRSHDSSSDCAGGPCGQLSRRGTRSFREEYLGLVGEVLCCRGRVAWERSYGDCCRCSLGNFSIVGF